MEVVAEGQFKKRFVFSTRQYGQYRGAGRLEVNNAGLRIVGRHVHSLRARWVFGVGLFFGVLVLTLGAFAPGFLLIYPIVEYWWLKREELQIPFSSITNVGADDATTAVAVSFDGHPWCSPVVLKSPQSGLIAGALRAHLELSRSAAGGPPAAALQLVPDPINAVARAGLIFGIASIFVVIPVAQTFLGIVGLSLSLLGGRKARQMNGLGARAANRGVICSAVGLVFSLLILWFIFGLSK